MGGNGGSPKTRKRKHNGDAEADAGADTDPNPPGDGSSCKDPEQDGEALAQREALAQSEADDLEDLLLIAAEAALIEFDETTGRPVRIAGNASASGSASGDEGNAPIDGLLKISRRMLRNQAEDLFEDLKGIHAIVKDRVRTHEMVPWAGTDGDTKRLRAFGFLGSPALERLDRSGAVRLHAPEKTGAEALRDERANRRAICVLDPAGEPLPAGANDRRERAAAVVRKRTVRPAEVADKLCAAILGSGSGNGDHHPLDPSLLSSGSLIAYQTNLHNGAKHLGAHLDAPLHEGFGKVIVTVAVRGSATILLIGKGTGGDDEGEQPAWRFRVEEGEAYVLSGNARNACLHAVLADDGGTGGGGGGHRESLNLRFGIHTVEEAERDIKRHWPDLW